MVGWLVAVYCLAVLSITVAQPQQQQQPQDLANNPSVKLFQEYLKINTTTHGDLSKAVDFWKARAKEEGLTITVQEFKKGYPVVVIKWPGADSSLNSIMLNSHMDVVPADSEGWTYPPFNAHIDEKGVIWGRGSQDMKCVSIQYFEALKRIKAKKVTLNRNVYMTLMPDEEVGAENGMIPFLASDLFKTLNAGVELDEGGSLPTAWSAVLYQDKTPWQIRVDCYGEAAHGSTFPPTNETAIGRCTKVINRMNQFREEEYTKYLSVDHNTNAGAYTVVNLNILNGGTANNIITGHVSLIYDIRLGINVDEVTFDKQLKEMIVANNVTMTYLLKHPQSPATLISNQNPYWVTFNDTVTKMGIPIKALVPPGATDGRYVRSSGIPAFGFSPMPNTEQRIHKINERLSATTFLRGVDVYEALITNLANIPKDKVAASPSAYIVKTTKPQ